MTLNELYIFKKKITNNNITEKQKKYRSKIKKGAPKV